MLYKGPFFLPVYLYFLSSCLSLIFFFLSIFSISLPLFDRFIGLKVICLHAAVFLRCFFAQLYPIETTWGIVIRTSIDMHLLIICSSESLRPQAFPSHQYSATSPVLLYPSRHKPPQKRTFERRPSFALYRTFPY